MIRLLSGNSRILLTVDEHGSWEQLYYPHPGLHQQLQRVRLGLFDTDGEAFAWLDDGPEAESGHLDGSNIGRSRKELLGLGLTVDDMVHPDMDIVVRRIILRNPGEVRRRMRIFHYQSMQLAGSPYRDTAYWDEQRKSVMHYKRSYYFQFVGHPDFTGFSCGEHTLKGLEGSHVDAEDGQLQGNVVSHGAADSIVQWDIEVPPGKERTVHLFVLIGRSRAEVHGLHQRIRGRDPGLFTNETLGYWKRWVQDKRIEPSYDLSSKARDVYRRSLFVVRNCSAETGSVIASPDATTLKHGGDGYEYCWWRDGGWISRAMSDAGMRQGASRFLRFAAKCQEPEGFYLHRHFPDGYLGPTWHAPQMIQIDQTASVIDAVHHQYETTGDLEELLQSWGMVRRAADFLMGHVDERGLPLPTFDLWEEKRAVNAYSVGMVVKGLRAAASIGQALGKRSDFWSDTAERMRHAALQHLWNPERNTLYKAIDPVDPAIDASTLLVDIFPPGDARYEQVVKAVGDALWQPGIGGIARYENDQYFGHENPWVICTLWLAQAHLKLGNAGRAKELIEWAAERAGPGEMLPEQLDAASGQRRGVVPLVWSHSTFIETVNMYSQRSPVGPPHREAAQVVGGARA